MPRGKLLMLLSCLFVVLLFSWGDSSPVSPINEKSLMINYSISLLFLWLFVFLVINRGGGRRRRRFLCGGAAAIPQPSHSVDIGRREVHRPVDREESWKDIWIPTRRDDHSF